MTTQSQSATEVQLQVLSAMILRDIRTRFGRTMWGYAIAVGWPTAHVSILFVIMSFKHTQPALGESLILFLSTGAVPFLMFMYMTRKIMESVGVNRPLMTFPQVKFLDLILSRALVELVSAFVSTSLVFLIMIVLGIDVVPHDVFLAVIAFLTAILLGFGLGTLTTNIAAIFPPFAMAFMLVTILLYGISGVFFLPDAMPPAIYDLMLWNPVTHIIMAFRSAFFLNYGQDASLLYPVIVSLVLLLAGLLTARFLTQRLM